MRRSFSLVPAVICAAAAAFALAGCSGSSSSHAASTTASSSAAATSSAAAATSASSAPPTTSAASSAGTAKVSAAGKKFLVVVAPVDHDLASFLTLPNASSVPTVTAAASTLATGETALVKTLKGDTWPVASRPAFAALEKAVTKEVAVYQACARDHSVAAIKATLLTGKPVIAARAAASNRVHTALGLPTT